MKATALKKILVDELGGTADGDAVSVPADRKVTVLVARGDTLIPVAKVRSVRFTDLFVNLVGDTEQMFVDPDDDFLVKAEDARSRDDARPGFH